MPKIIYNRKAKSAIVNAALEARHEKKTWREAFAAAKAAGYKGSLQGITKMIRALRLKGALKRHKAANGRRGRKPGGGGVSSIEALVASLVKARVREVLDAAIAELQKARGL